MRNSSVRNPVRSSRRGCRYRGGEHLALLALAVVGMELLGSSAAVALTVETVDKGEMSGRSLSIPDGKVATLAAGDKATKIPCDEIVAISLSEPVEKAAFPAVILRNGNLLCGTISATTQQGLEIDSKLVGRVVLPLKYIRAVLFGEAELPSRVEKDTVVLRNGDSITGALRELSATKLDFESETELGRLEVPLASVKYVHLAEGQGQFPMEPDFLLAQANLTDGSALTGRLLSFTTGPEGTATLELLLGQTVKIPAGSVARITFKNGRLVYLSDMRPVAVEEIPFFDVVWHYKVDRSVDGGPLRLGKKVYRKGLGTHSYCRLVYDLRKGFKTFASDIGIDEEVGLLGHVAFRVLGDGRELLNVQSRGADPPKTVSLDVAGVERLELITDFGEDLDIGDHADWADARLLR